MGKVTNVNTDNWTVTEREVELSRILKKKGRGECPNCDREMGMDDISWAGEIPSTISIKCSACDTKIIKFDSWCSVYEEEGDDTWIMFTLCDAIRLDMPEASKQ